jgi:signal transduction histidine kinase
MNIRAKLSLGYFIAALLIVVIGFVGLQGVLSISNSFDKLVSSTSQEIPTLEKISAQFFNMRLESTNYIALLENENSKKNTSNSEEKEKGAAEMKKTIQQFNAADISAKELIVQYISFTPDFNAPIADGLERIRLDQESILKQITDNSKGYDAHKSAEILDLLEIIEEEHAEKIEEALKEESDFAAKETTQAHALVQKSKWLIGIFSFLAVAMAILLGLGLARHISRPLSILTYATEKLGHGDYQTKVNIQRTDEIGVLATAFNSMVDELEHAKILVQQKKQLEVLNLELNNKNEALDNFVYRVSHDLKAPIINIAALIAMLQRKWEAPDTRLAQTMSHISNSTVKLQQTITDLLELSRLERKTEKKQEIIDLTNIMGGVQKSLREQIKRSGASIETDFDDAPTFVFPKVDIESILTNLTSNAIKYARPDVPPALQIRSLTASSNICITVSDNGLGIDLEKNNAKMFGMFMRFHDHVEGSGVGLYIIRKLVTDAGGKIEVESTVGKGTIFRIYLPLKPLIDSPTEPVSESLPVAQS